MHRGVVTQVDDHAGGTRGVIQSPYRFSAHESGATGGAAYRGEHNAEVIREWLGSDASAFDVEALSATGVLKQNLFAPKPTAES